MGYRLNRLDETVFMALTKPMLTEFGIHYRLETCAVHNLQQDLATNFALYSHFSQYYC